MVEVAPCDYGPVHESHDWDWRGGWVWCPGRDSALPPEVQPGGLRRLLTRLGCYPKGRTE